MAFGFLIERFGLFLKRVGRGELQLFQRHLSFLFGIGVRIGIFVNGVVGVLPGLYLWLGLG